LQTLYIYYVTDDMAAMIANIESLTQLIIRKSRLTDEGAASLTKLSKLQALRLLDCDSPINIETLRRQMPSCRIDYSVRQLPTR